MSDVVAERRHQVFPELNDAQLQRIARYGERRHALAGEILYDQGTSALGIHVVLSGAVEIVRPGILGDEPITVQRAGEFTESIARWPSEPASRSRSGCPRLHSFLWRARK